MARSLSITIDGLEKLGADLEALGSNKLPLAIYRALAGKGGEALATEMRQREPVVTGDLRSQTKVHDMGHQQVRIGYLGQLSFGNRGGGRFQKGAWVESGTQPHDIIVGRGHTGHFAKALAFNGVIVDKVSHPGARAQRIAAKSIRAAMWEVESAVVDEIDKLTGGGM